MRIRLPIVVAVILVMMAPYIDAVDAPDPADLPAPITSSKFRDSGALDELSESPIKPRPYKWMVDDPLTPTSPSTTSQFVTEIDNVDPYDILERPGVPVGWFADVEITAARANVSNREQSGSLLMPTFTDSISPPFTSLDWMAMPKFTLGYRRPEGVGELSASYRFLITQGDGTFAPFGGGTGNISSRLQLHVLDLDCTFTDLFPTDLTLVPYQVRLTGGVRVAGIDEKTSANGGTIQNQSSTNTFVGAGPHVAFETLYPIASGRWTLFGKLDAAGLIGQDRQKFSQTTTGPGAASASASTSGASGVPVVGLRTGLNWLPDWGAGNVKFSGGYQWERWFYLGPSTDSFNELTIQGPFVRGEVAF